MSNEKRVNAKYLSMYDTEDPTSFSEILSLVVNHIMDEHSSESVVLLLLPGELFLFMIIKRLYIMLEIEDDPAIANILL